MHHAWSYDVAFSRHEGLLTAEEQQRLRGSRVAIIGMGGVGGMHLITLTRLGIGAFHIADPDTYELANFNRQYGANMRTLGQSKVEVMAEEARAINPELNITTFSEAISPDNISDFLDGVDILVDGVDFFALDARRLVFQEARRRGIWGVTAGPICFGAAWFVFSPEGMSFDKFFDLNDSMDPMDQISAFAVGLTPRPIHLTYLDVSQVTSEPGKGTSVGLACQLCSGVVGAEVAKILLGRPGIRPAPCFAHFDAYRCKLRTGRLWFANRHPLRLMLRKWLRRHWEQGRNNAQTTELVGTS